MEVLGPKCNERSSTLRSQTHLESSDRVGCLIAPNYRGLAGHWFYAR